MNSQPEFHPRPRRCVTLASGETISAETREAAATALQQLGRLWSAFYQLASSAEADGAIEVSRQARATATALSNISNGLSTALQTQKPETPQ